MPNLPGPVESGSIWGGFERLGWDSHVEPYHDFYAPISQRVAPGLLDAAGVVAGVRVLDVCCGPGYMAGAAAGRGAIACGVDIAPNMVALAGRLYPNVAFRTADASHLPWPDGQFDAVVCNFGLHHLDDPQTGMREFARVLRPGGRVAFTVWDKERSGMSVVPDAVYRAGVLIPQEMPSPPEMPEYHSAEQARPLLEAAGLTLTGVSSNTFTQHYPNADALWDGWLASAIRTQPILARQTEEVRHRARAAYDDAIAERFPNGGRIEVPVAVVIISGQAPG